MKFNPLQIALASALALSGAAFAQTAAPAAAAPATAAAPASPWSYNIDLTSNYKFRGQDQDTSRTSRFKPALQGGVDYAFANGFYLGNWNSMVNFAAPNGNKANLEVDLYGGYKWAVGDWGFDLGALQYYYPGATQANTTEVYAGTSYGPFSAKYSSTVSKGYFGTGYGTNSGRGTGYLNIAFAKEVATNLTLKAAIGQTAYTSNVKNAVNGPPNFTDYSIGASYDLGNGLALGGYVQGASNGGNAAFNYPNSATTSVNRSTLLFTLTKTL